jgi:hypothetical protein
MLSQVKFISVYVTRVEKYLADSPGPHWNLFANYPNQYEAIQAVTRAIKEGYTFAELRESTYFDLQTATKPEPEPNKPLAYGANIDSPVFRLETDSDTTASGKRDSAPIEMDLTGDESAAIKVIYRVFNTNTFDYTQFADFCKFDGKTCGKVMNALIAKEIIENRGVIEYRGLLSA